MYIFLMSEFRIAHSIISHTTEKLIAPHCCHIYLNLKNPLTFKKKSCPRLFNLSSPFIPSPFGYSSSGRSFDWQLEEPDTQPSSGQPCPVSMAPGWIIGSYSAWTFPPWLGSHSHPPSVATPDSRLFAWGRGSGKEPAVDVSNQRKVQERKYNDENMLDRSEEEEEKC